jgi:hypothetical protein
MNHQAVAESYAEDYDVRHVFGPESDAELLASAQVHATLALAHEVSQLREVVTHAGLGDLEDHIFEPLS